MKFWISAPALAAVIACSPVATTRIGPSIPSRDAECDVEVLRSGELPVRPYRDVAMLSVSNCQDYEVNPCRRWIIKSTCAVGGQVVYYPEDASRKDGRSDDIDGTVSFRLMVAAYVGELPPGSNDPVLNSTESTCAPSTVPPDQEDDPLLGVCKEEP